jgi:hypothetical protein
MTDLESRLRSLTFRELPPGWRGSIVGATSKPGWRKWLAPHPTAWAALAAIWLALALVSQTFERPLSSASNVAAKRNVDPLSEPTLLAFHLRRTAATEPPL